MRQCERSGEGRGLQEEGKSLFMVCEGRLWPLKVGSSALGFGIFHQDHTSADLSALGPPDKALP